MRTAWVRPPRAYLLLAVVTLLLRIVTALPIERAGYMDASYTVHVGSNLAQGRGFVEEVLWNYLDEPRGLPHPSNLYWLPLPTLLSAVFFVLLGVSFHAAQIPFILLSCAIPLLAYYLARRLSERNDFAWTAGLLAAFSGFFTVYWVSPDNFTTFAVAADFTLICGAIAIRRSNWRWFLAAGVFGGLAQLSRADAAVLLVAILITFAFWRGQRDARTPPLGNNPAKASTPFGGNWLKPLIIVSVALGAGFLLVLLPWIIRNTIVVGSPLAPGTTRTLWLLSYDEFFNYDVTRLTLERYLDWGIGNIIGSKLTALGFNTLVLLFGVTQIFLAPFALLGFWKLRDKLEIRVALVYLVLLIVVMSFVFTFPAMRGSMFHSSTAMVLYAAVATPFGLEAAIGWLARHRRSWQPEQAQRVFRAGIVVLALFFSLFLYAQGVLGNVLGGSDSIALWNKRDIEYRAIDQQLDALGIPNDMPILTVDPPSFINETGRRSIYLPTESVEAIYAAAKQLGTEYLVLQFDHPRPLRELYLGEAEIPGLAPIYRTVDGLGKPVTLFRLNR